jgi:hypothetical protein
MTSAHEVLFREALSILFSPKLVPNFKPEKFKTLKTETDFNGFNCQKTKFAGQELFVLFWVWQSF